MLLASRMPIAPLSTARFGPSVRPQALRSARVSVAGSEVDIHAVHVPNGSANGWEKIDHMWALRRGLEPPHGRPQILCGDFNAPRSEACERITTFGQSASGELLARADWRYPWTSERPWDAAAWDAGERAVLERLGQDCGMPHVFRLCHPDSMEVTWVARGVHEERGRRLDHVFASRELEPIACRHMHGWRFEGLSDHSAIEAVFAVRR